MSQSDGVRNPCINICRMDHHGTFCQGCWRTLLEIGRWDRMNDEQKAAVAELLEHRRSAKVSRLASPGDPTLENGVPQ
ncbi:DUF1289 domain-containing protein [Caballeronia humi]|uniref:Fe-S protein n=1 Tax=Caballeronia humi TaxID=326474 RepID=A0A158J669_9BURK|nr:DUF1289 domain-containing protein [Caballeronia humi]SAL64452.1 hypothetical protein AWB65_06042 [Caballeronia humi]